MRTALAPILLAALLLLPTASALIATTPTRFDLGEVEAGRVLTATVHVQNKGAAPTRLDVVATALENEAIAVEPASFSLMPGETRPVVVTVGLAVNASGGRHDPRIEFIEAPAEGAGSTVGRVAVSVPVVFWIENLKLGNLEARHAPRGEDAAARVLVQNFLGSPVEAHVTLTVADAAGHEVARREGRTAPVEANASTSLDLALPTAALPAGAYTLRAEASHEGRTSNAWSVPLFVGERRLGATQPTATVGDDGTVAFAARLVNDGSVALEGGVAFEFAPQGGGGAYRSVSADAGRLAPGEARDLQADAKLAPGAYGWRAVAYWTGGGRSEVAGGSFTVAPTPDASGSAAAATPLPVLALLAGLGLAALARRRGA